MISFDQLDELRRTVPNMGDQVLKSSVANKTRDWLIPKIEGNPLLRRYLRQYGFGPVRNTQPWQALGEQLATARALASVGTPGYDDIVFESNLRESAGMSDDVAGVLWGTRALIAQPYLWSNEVNALARSAPLPSHVISRSLLPYPMMFISREAACAISSATSYAPSTLAGRETDWILIVDVGDSFELLYNATGKEQPQIILCGARIQYGRRFPEDFPHEPSRIGTEALLQMLAFISSPFVETVPNRLDRPCRREMAKAGVPKEQIEQVIHTVVLRRAAQESVAAYELLSTVERKHHWWVSGHYRAQWYARDQAHKVIWIAPYVKGDLSKPLLTKVYAVTR